MINKIKTSILDLTIGQIFSRIEKYIWLFVIIVYVVIQWVTFFLDSSFIALNSPLESALSATALLSVLRIITLQTKRPKIKEHGDRFENATDAIIRSKIIKRMDLLALNSAKYFSVLSNRDIHIKHLRILLMSKKAIEESPTAHKKEIIKQELSNILHKWQELHKRGKIEHLEIHEYDFCCHFHFLIIENRSAHYGFFNICPQSNATSIPRNYSITHGDTVSNDFIMDLSTYFNDIFKNYSTLVFIS
ncbi:MAG: hypothetical protein ACFFG0_54255 [Candidatus Thorarchaeota archaeon]